MKGVAPPESRYPTIKAGQLVPPEKAAMGFPTLPVLGATAPAPELMNPLIDYDWGAQFDPNDASGIPTNAPPKIRKVMRMLVPKVDADGNEVGGIPTVLLEAPLGTYLGWNITANGAPLPCRQAVRLRRRHGSLRPHESRARGQWRPAPVARGALRRPRRLRRGGAQSRPESARRGIPARGGRRGAGEGGGSEQRLALMKYFFGYPRRQWRYAA